MKKIVYSLSIALALLYTTQAHAQGMAVNTTGTAAAPSAILDASSTTQGVLVPRMTTSQRTNISAPATGLLVYQTDGTTPGFYYYNGTAWTALSGGGSTSSGNSINAFKNATGATYTVQTTDQLIYFSNPTMVFTLPKAADAGIGKVFYFLNSANPTSNAVQVAPSSSDVIYSAYTTGTVTNTINSNLSTGFGAMTIASDGVSKWFVTSYE